MTRSRILVITVLLFVLAASAALWLLTQVNQATVELRQVSVQVPVNNRAQVQLQLAVSNTLSQPLRYLGASYRVAAGGKLLVQGTVKLQGSVDAGAESLVLVPLTLDLKRLEALRKNATGGSVDATISGGLRVHLGSRKKTIPFTHRRRLALGGSGITSKLTRFQIHLLDGGRARVRARLDVTNPGATAIQAIGLDYRVLLDKKQVAHGSLRSRDKIPPRGSGPLELVLELDLPRRKEGAPPAGAVTIVATVKAVLGQREISFPFRLHKQLVRRTRSSTCQARGVSVDAREDGAMGVLVTLACEGEGLAQQLAQARVRFRATLNGVEVASGAVQARRSSVDQKKLEIQLPLTLQPGRMRAAQQQARGPQSLKITGSVSGLGKGAASFPFELVKELSPGGMRVQLDELAVSLWGDRLRLAPRLRIVSQKQLPDLQQLQLSYAVSLGGQQVGRGKARLFAHTQQRQLLGRAQLVLSVKRLRKNTPPKGGTLPLKIEGVVQITTAAGKILHLPYSFTKKIHAGGQALALNLRQVKLSSPARDRLVLDVGVEVRSKLTKQLTNVRAVYRATIGGRQLLAGTLRLPAPGGPRPGRARLRLVLDPGRLQQLKGRGHGGRMLLVLQGTLSATMPGQPKPLRVPFTVARSIRPGQGGFTVTVEALKINALTAGQIKAELGLLLEGRAVPAGDLDASYVVSVGSRPLVEGTATLRAAGRGRWRANVPLLIHTAALETARAGAGVGPLLLQVRGKVRAMLRGRPLVVPFAVTRRVALGGPRPLEVSVSKLVIKAGSAGTMKLVLLLRLKSRLQLDLADLNASYRATAGGATLLDGSFVLRQLAAGGSGQARVPVTIHKERLEALKKGARGAAIPLLIAGRVAATLQRPGEKPRKLVVPFSLRKALAPAGKPMSVEMLGLRILEITEKRVRLELKLRINSKLPEAVRDARASYGVAVRGQTILTGQLKLKPLPASGSMVARLPMTVQAAKMKAIKKQSKGKKTRVVITGTVTAMTSRGPLRLPFTIHKQATLMARPFAVKLHKLDFSGMNFGNRTFRAILSVTNKTSGAIRNLNIEGQLTLGRGLHARVLNRNVTIGAGQTVRLTLAVRARRGAILRLIARRLRGKRTNSRMKLRVSGQTEDGTTIRSREEQQGEVAVGR